MVAWLEDDEGGPTDVEVWGINKEHYGFGDLDLYLKRGGTGLVSEEELKKKKKKKNVKGKDKHKGKGKDKADKTSKRSCK
jgi:hypothetical protein